MCSWHDCMVSCQHGYNSALKKHAHIGCTGDRVDCAGSDFNKTWANLNELTGCPERVECYPGCH